MMSRRWQPSPIILELVNRDRVVSKALQAYAALTTSVDRGAVCDLDQLK